MSNSYYTPPTDVAALTRARSGDINLRDDAVDAAFDKVPDEAKLKRGTVNYAVDTGNTDAYIASLPYVPSGYVDGLLVSIKPINGNTGASTININSLGVKSIRRGDATVLLAGDIVAGIPLEMRYSSTSGFFHIQGSTAGSVTSASSSAAAAAASASAASVSAGSAASSAAAAQTSGSAIALAAAIAASSGAGLSGFILDETGAVETTIQQVLREVISAFRFMTASQIADVKAGTALIDVTAALQSAFNTGRTVYFPAGTYLVSSPLLPKPNTTMRIRGEHKRLSIIQAAVGFTGYVLNPVGLGGYDIEGIQVKGLLATGVYGLGDNTPGSGGGTTVLNSVTFSDCDECISFGSEYEHPLGLHYDDLYISTFINCGINLGGLTGAASSGESNYWFGRIAITNANGLRNEFSVSVTVDTPSTSFDRLTWSGAVPRYGFMIMRSTNGSTAWHVPPNWATTTGFTATTFDAAKTAGETWFYRCVPNTIGLLARRAKSVAGGTIQTEYVGIGQLYSDIRGANINSVYYEVRDFVPPFPSLCGVAVTGGTAEIGGGYIDGPGYGIVAGSNAQIKSGGINGNNIKWAPFGWINASTDTCVEYGNITGVTAPYTKSVEGGAFEFNFSGREYSSSLHKVLLGHTTETEYVQSNRGIDKTTWGYNSTAGGYLTGINALDVTPLSKSTVLPALRGNSTLSTSLPNTVSTPILTIPVPSNGSIAASFSFLETVVNAGVTRQSAAGQLHITGMNAAATGVVAAVTTSTIAYALQAGTLTIAFTVAASGANLVVSATSTSSQANGTLILVPVSASSTSALPVMTQS